MTAPGSTTPLLDTGQVEPIVRSYAAAFPVAVTVYDADGGLVAQAGEAVSRDGPASADIEVSGQRLGTVAVTLRAPFGEDGAASVAALLAELIADRAAQHAELESMAAELLDKYEEVTLLYDLSSALGSVFDVPALCEIALDKALQAVPAEHAHVALLEEGGRELAVAASRGDVEPALGERVLQTGEQELVHASEGHPQARLSVPIVYLENGERTVLGVLTLAGKPRGERFTAGDAKVATAIAAQLAVAIHGSRLVDSLREAERVQQELEIAAEIQRSLLPARAPEVTGLQVAGLCVPAARVGGDYYDLIVDRTGRLSLVIADVAGHSIGSALMMAMARSVIRREIADGKGPAAVLAATNAAMYDDLVRAGLFITVACARYEHATRRLEFANGAHNPPLLRRSRDGAVEELDADGMAVGMVAGAGYMEGSVELGDGDTVLLYTDGVTEARDAVGSLLGEERLKELIAAAGSLPPAELVERVSAAAREHRGGVPQQDDVTLVALRAGEAG